MKDILTWWQARDRAEKMNSNSVLSFSYKSYGEAKKLLEKDTEKKGFYEFIRIRVKNEFCDFQTKLVLVQ